MKTWVNAGRLIGDLADDDRQGRQDKAGLHRARDHRVAVSSCDLGGIGS